MPSGVKGAFMSTDGFLVDYFNADTATDFILENVPRYGHPTRKRLELLFQYWKRNLSSQTTRLLPMLMVHRQL